MRILYSLALPLTLATGGFLQAAEMSASSDVTPTFKQYCFQCHGNAASMAGVNLEQLTSQASIGESYQHWNKVADALERKLMPPKGMAQPSDEQRRLAVSSIRNRLQQYALKHDGDPGAVTMRRLTSGEYAYTVRDLTGLDLKFDRDFASDSVGGEGFTNFGDVQFLQDANLERYLEAAKRIADHAVIGSGPIEFFENPGKSGFELSAINRIRNIYEAHGFRAAAGEGGKPYGLDRYGKAFYAAWRFKHRKALGEPSTTLAAFAAREGVSSRFVEHIWSVVHQQSPTYPTSEVVAQWHQLPSPGKGNAKESEAALRAGCEQIQKFVINWPRHLFAAGELAAGGAGDERALVISEATLPANSSHALTFNVRGRKQKTSTIHLTSVAMNPAAKDKSQIIWRNAAVRIRMADKKTQAEGEPLAVSQQRPLASAPSQPLRDILDEQTVNRLSFGKLADGTQIGPQDFAGTGDGTVSFDINLPEDAVGLEFKVTAEMGPSEARDAVYRLTITEAGEAQRGRPTWALLADAKGEGFLGWRKNVLNFAANLPQVSHSEATPSDNDPIPAPFNNTYNQPERDHFHYKLKYYRGDRFLMDKMLDDATRTKLNNAWNDLLASFEYHSAYIRFVAEKYKLDLQGKGAEQLTLAEIDALPEEPRMLIKPMFLEYQAVTDAQRAARARHVDDCIQLARLAWRRSLTPQETQSLRAFYQNARQGPELDHTQAIRALLARILIAPAFLFRLEQPASGSGEKPLSGSEIANRLSYFLWSSMPDEELRRAATAGRLSDPQELKRQVKRMLADAKAERFSSEFFGQWLGFYRFDQYRGVDTTRFPEFTDEVKQGMHQEAVAFFEHVVRKDRPIKEMLSADYTFLTGPLAKHYAIGKEIKSESPVLVEGANAIGRGGMLRLGAVLTATSAPLRTSPVKRGDWVLRRILGTPTPPPPADAGSLPADDKAFGGLSVFERLESHKRNPSCASCHTRIDPLGFPLERYDAVGRLRDTYSDGKAIQDAASLPDKTMISGVDGLQRYLASQEKQVVRTMSQKLLGYALGRTILGSDQILVDRLVAMGGEASISQMASEIVVSKQFRYRRDQSDVVANKVPGL